VGVKLPKGLLLYGPPGCRKTHIAKTLSAETGLSFVALSTADCKVGWIGHAAAKIKQVFTEARGKQPTLIFIDELDAVCPPRGAYHDCISQEVTAQPLQEIGGLLSDSQAIFLVGATNRPDQVDSAILSRFAEQIEIPLPDATTRLALLELFLGPLRFSGDRNCVIRTLALATDGQSGRDLRNLINQAVLSAAKRMSFPQNFALSEGDFATRARKELMELRIWKRICLSPWIRLNFYTRGLTVSFGHRSLGWLTFGQRGIRATPSTRTKEDFDQAKEFIRARPRGEVPDRTPGMEPGPGVYPAGGEPSPETAREIGNLSSAPEPRSSRLTTTMKWST
jgi:SpoVK/Ycf46/Vps4 family AAA+-type ATPase